MPRRLAFLFAALALVLSGTSHAQDSATVRIGFLLNFARYVEWPEGTLKPDAPVRFCLAPGDSAMSGKLGELTAQSVQGRAIQIKHAARPADLEDCHVVYLPVDLPAASMINWQEAAARSHTLTVSETPDFIEAGGMIGLVAVGSRYRFDINLVNARRAELRISSYLLKLARMVK